MPQTQAAEPVLSSADCIDHRGVGCAGDIEPRMALSGTGIPYVRCDKAWADRLDREQVTRERYGHPDSAMPPPGFDPSYAGERWDEDDW